MPSQSQNKGAYFGSFLLSASLGLPTLIATHLQPQTVFLAEWGAVFFLFLGLAFFAGNGRANLCKLGWVITGIAVVLVAALCWAGGGTGIAYPLYLGLLLVSLAVGGLLDTEDVTTVAWGLVGCAVLQALVGGVQLTGVNVGEWVLRKIYLQIYGNVGQANHFADLIYLGLASLAMLRGVAYEHCFAGIARSNSRWRDLGFVSLASVLVLAAAFSASRGVWLYIGCFAVLGAMARVRGDESGRHLGLGLLLIAAISVAAQLFVSYSGILAHLGVVSAMDRLGDAGSNGQRLYNWQAALEAIKAHPWIGEGPASFYKASVDAMFTTPPASFPKFAEHAHNLPLNLAAELGLPVALVTMAVFAWWYLRHLVASSLSATRAWALACIGVIGLHSMVEYPLWYAYFIVPFGLCMGVADSEDRRLPTLRVPRAALVAVALSGLLTLAWIMHDWLAVRDAYEMLNGEEPSVELSTRTKVRERLEGVSRFSVFAYHAESLRLQSWRTNEGGADAIADRCDRLWAYKPGWYMMMRCGEAYASSNREASLERIVRAACDGFPRHRTPLLKWAEDYDGTSAKSLKIAGRACLVR